MSTYFLGIRTQTDDRSWIKRLSKQPVHFIRLIVQSFPKVHWNANLQKVEVQISQVHAGR